MASNVAQQGSGSPVSFNIRKRRRPPLACEKCRNRKIKCDCANPCGPCVKSGTKCTYVYDDRIPQNSPGSEGRPDYAFAVESGPQPRQQSHTPLGREIMPMAHHHVPSVPLQALGASQAPGITESMLGGSSFTSMPTPDTGEYVQQPSDNGESLYTKTETSSSMIPVWLELERPAGVAAVGTGASMASAAVACVFSL